jgi:hypothetical protein
MKWMRERDSLIAQTLAFVQTVTGKKEDAGKPQAVLETASPDLDFAALDAIRNALEMIELPKDALTHARQSAPSKSIQVARPIVPSELQNEIRSRIESFRAHQERFNRERAEYFNATLSRLRAAIDDAAAARIGK